MIIQDDYHIRDKDSFQHAHELIKPHGVIDEILEWLKSEIQNEWRWQLVDLSSHTRPGRYIFYFDNERDFTAFMLKWS